MGLVTAASARAAVRLFAWTGLFVAAGYLGRATIIDGGALSLVWPAAGVAVLWFATARRATVWLDLLAFTTATFVVNVSTGASVRLGVVFVLANLVQLAGFFALARRLVPDVWGFGGRRPLGRIGELGAVVVAALLGGLVAASLGTVGLRLTGVDGSLLSFVAWWGRNAVGIVAVSLVGLLAGPLLGDASRRYGARGVVAALGHALRPRSSGRAAEALLLVTTTCVTYAVVFETTTGSSLAFLVLVPTFWAGIRFSPLAATVHSLVCAASTITFTLLGSGPFMVFEEAAARALVAQLCVLMTVVAGLSLAFSHALERHVAAELTALMDASRMAAMISTDLDGRIRTFGVGAERMLGYAATELVGRATPELFLDADELAEAAAELGVGAQEVLSELARIEAEPRTWTFVRRTGERFFARMALSELRGAGGLVTGYLGVAIDVTEAIRDRDRAEHLQQQLAHLAHHDALTGLPNRRWFLQQLDEHLGGDANRRRGALLMVDLDHFKEVNDTHGHAAGDAFLTGVAQELRGCVRRHDALARLGGDEFAVLLPGADAPVAERVASALVRAVRDFSRGQEGVRDRVSASVGGVLIDGGESADVLHAADEVLYAVKAAGRNQHLVLGLRRHQPEPVR